MTALIQKKPIGNASSRAEASTKLQQSRRTCSRLLHERQGGFRSRTSLDTLFLRNHTEIIAEKSGRITFSLHPPVFLLPPRGTCLCRSWCHAQQGFFTGCCRAGAGALSCRCSKDQRVVDLAALFFGTFGSWYSKMDPCSCHGMRATRFGVLGLGLSNVASYKLWSTGL